MISRPNFLCVAPALAGVLFIVWGVIGPTPTSIWKRVDPVGYAASRIRATRIFTGPAESDTGELEKPLDSWRVIAQSAAADSVYRALASDTSVVASLYGIAGLALHDSVAASVYARRFARDSTPVAARLTPCAESIAQPAADLADSARSPRFAQMLLGGDAACRSSAGLVRLTRISAATATELL